MPHPEHGKPRVDYRTFLSAYEHAWRRYHADPTPHTLRILNAGEEILIRELLKPGRFELGQLAMTRGAAEAMQAAGHIPPEFLLRHKHGDWGDIPEEDVRENEWSLEHGARLFSVYATRREETLWVITESDRSATTMLLPDEY